MSSLAEKSWVSPFVVVTYAAVAVSGILMLFHINLSGVQHIHQWGGILFLIGGTIHIFLNRRILLSYFKNTKAAYVILAGALMIMLLVSLIPLKGDGGGRHGHGKGEFAYGNRYQR